MPFITASKVITDSAQINPGTIVDSDINSSAAIAASKLQALSVGANGGVLPSTGVANAHVAATAAIDYSKLAALTQGGVLIGSTSNVPTVLAPGTSGSVLKSQGAGADPVWGGSSAPFFIRLTDEVGGVAGTVDFMPVRQAADGGLIVSICAFFMPAATITSIQLFARANTSAAGNVVIDFSINDFTDGAAATQDTSVGNVYSDFASNTNWQLVTIPAAGYNGLTTGRIWSCKVSRQGGDGSDTLTTTLDIGGVLINI